MQAADHSIIGEGLVVLDESHPEALLLKGLFIVGFEEKTPLVFVDRGFEDH